MASGRFDAGVDQINITAERAKVVDFVPYSQDGIGLLVRKGTTGIDINDLCGRTLVLTQGSAQVGIADKLSAKCVAAGQKPIAFLNYPNSADTYLALANGRGDGFLIGKASGVNIARGNDKLAMTAGHAGRLAERVRDRGRQGQHRDARGAPTRAGERGRRRQLPQDPGRFRRAGRGADGGADPEFAACLM